MLVDHGFSIGVYMGVIYWGRYHPMMIDVEW